MLRRVAERVLVHESAWCQSNAVVVQGRAGVLLIDPGLHGDEMTGLAKDLSDWGQTIVAGFSTHPHWDHMLWHASLGAAPRYATSRGAITARDRLAGGIDARRLGIPEDTPLDLLGDMLSDVFIPMLDLRDAADPIADYLAALALFEAMASAVDVVIPGHGSVGGAGELLARIDQDRAYVQALRDGRDPLDSRVGPSPKPGWEWVRDVHERQLQALKMKSKEKPS